MMTARRKRAIDFARRELLNLIEYRGLETAFAKDGTSNEHWPRCLACEVLKAADEGDPMRGRPLWDLCIWLRERLYKIHGEGKGQEIEEATARLEIRFIEYLEDRRRLQSRLG